VGIVRIERESNWIEGSLRASCPWIEGGREIIGVAAAVWALGSRFCYLEAKAFAAGRTEGHRRPDLRR
jgi:hypothetical protein